MALIIGGKEVPCDVEVVDWKQSGLQCVVGKGARKRDTKKQDIDLFVWHWTGGEGNEKSLFNVLINRELGVEFYIRYDGKIFQFCDPVFVDSFDAGVVNRRSVGCEIQGVGTGPDNPKFKRNRIKDNVQGRTISVADFTEAQYKSALALAKAVSDAIPTLPKKVNRDPNDATKPFSSLFDDAGIKKDKKGHIGHFNVNPAKKDCGTKLLKHFIDNGF